MHAPAVHKLSVVVPVYRGAETVTELVERLGDELRPSYDFEIVLVEDCSPDNSRDVMRGLAAKYSWVVCVHLSRNFGEHNAVLCGLHYAQGDFVVIMDDDLQNPPSEVRRMVAEIEAGYDVVYSRYERKQHHWFRNFGSKLNDRVANVMLNKPKNLYLSSFKALSRFVVDELVKFDGPFPYIDGLILRTTRNIKVVTVEHQARPVGTSGYTLTKLVKLWVNMFTSFSILPLRVATVLGLVVAGLGVVLSVVFAVERVRHPELPLGWASLVISVMLLAGVQLFALGMLGEYLGRLFLKVGGEPQFVVRETRNLPGVATRRMTGAGASRT